MYISGAMEGDFFAKYCTVLIFQVWAITAGVYLCTFQWLRLCWFSCCVCIALHSIMDATVRVGGTGITPFYQCLPQGQRETVWFDKLMDYFYLIQLQVLVSSGGCSLTNYCVMLIHARTHARTHACTYTVMFYKHDIHLGLSQFYLQKQWVFPTPHSHTPTPPLSPPPPTHTPPLPSAPLPPHTSPPLSPPPLSPTHTYPPLSPPPPTHTHTPCTLYTVLGLLVPVGKY